MLTCFPIPINFCRFADDVQYCVLKSSPKIIVSWHVASEENTPRQTFVHAYQLATDYQMVSHISNIEPVDHYVSALHNIEGKKNFQYYILVVSNFV